MAEKRNNIDSTKQQEVDIYAKDSKVRTKGVLDQSGHVADYQLDDGALIEAVGETSGNALSPLIRGDLRFYDETGQQSALIENTRDGAISIEPNILGGNTYLAQTTLTSAINDFETTVPVVSTDGFRLSGNGYYRLLAGTEIIWAAGKTDTSFTGCVRGAENTTAAIHLISSALYEAATGMLNLLGPVAVDGITESVLVPNLSTSYLGTATQPWTNVTVTDVTAEDVIPSTSSGQLGTASDKWADVNAEDVWIYSRLIVSSTAGEGCATSLVPNASNSYDLGNSSYRWRTIYLVNSPDVSSARNTKKNIGDIPVGLDAVRKLRPVVFQRKRALKDKWHYGFIADEVEQVLPYAATKTSVTYDEVIPVLTRAVQELSDEVERLKTPWWKRLYRSLFT